MELKLPLVLFCLCALAITSTEAAIPKCCIRTKNHIPLQMLWKVQRWSMQSGGRACDISALLLHVKDMRTPVCAHPKVLGILKKVRQQTIRNKQK
ncbi:C-C motif chemokine 27a [Gasterosteus aculeatus]